MPSLKNFATIAASIAAAAAVALPVAAQFAKPEDAVKYRQAALTVLGSHMGRINDQLKSASPDMQAIQTSANVVEAMSKLPWEAFGHSTEGVGTTRAKPELFQNEAKVKELSEKMQAEATKLNTAAKTGDIKAVRTQFSATGQSCKNCHDDYRTK